MMIKEWIFDDLEYNAVGQKLNQAEYTATEYKWAGHPPGLYLRTYAVSDFNDFPNVISFQLGTYADDTNPVLVVSPTDPTK